MNLSFKLKNEGYMVLAWKPEEIEGIDYANLESCIRAFAAEVIKRRTTRRKKPFVLEDMR